MIQSMKCTRYEIYEVYVRNLLRLVLVFEVVFFLLLAGPIVSMNVYELQEYEACKLYKSY